MSQLGSSSKMVVHSAGANSESLSQIIVASGPNDFVTPASLSNPSLPPSSAIPFRSKLANLSTVVVADFDTSFENQGFHSHYDTMPLDSSILCQAADTIAKSLFLSAASGTSFESLNSSVSVNCSLVSQLVDCLTQSLDCSLSRALRIPIASRRSETSPTYIPTKYPSTYVPELVPQVKGVEKFIYEFMSSLTRTNIPESSCKETQCPEVCVSFSCISSACFRVKLVLMDSVGSRQLSIMMLMIQRFRTRLTMMGLFLSS